jgi:uncharacterized protein YrrD
MSHHINSSELYQYLVETFTGDHIGYVDHLYFNETNWTIPAFRVDARKGFHRSHVIITWLEVDRVDLSSRRIFLKEEVTQNEIFGQPERDHQVQKYHTSEDFNRLEIHTPEKSFGKVEAVLFHSKNWTIESIIIRTHKLFGGKHILIRPEQVQSIDWDHLKLNVTLHESEVINGPELKHADSAYETLDPGI